MKLSRKGWGGSDALSQKTFALPARLLPVPVRYKNNKQFLPLRSCKAQLCICDMRPILAELVRRWTPTSTKL